MVAGSTHEEDESALFEAFAHIRETRPNAMLIIAPRYPERFERVAQMAGSRGLQVRKLGDPADATRPECLVVDQMGRLLEFYAAADMAFIGGTLANVGGHNPLEAAALGRPLILGPHTEHIEQVARMLLDAGAAIRVADADELCDAWSELNASAGRRETMGRASRHLLEQKRGALEKNLQAIRALLFK